MSVLGADQTRTSAAPRRFAARGTEFSFEPDCGIISDFVVTDHGCRIAMMHRAPQWPTGESVQDIQLSADQLSVTGEGGAQRALATDADFLRLGRLKNWAPYASNAAASVGPSGAGCVQVVCRDTNCPVSPDCSTASITSTPCRARSNEAR